MKKFILRAMAWLLAVAMLLPSAGAALTTAYAEEEKPAYSGSVTFSDSQWWTEREVGQSEMLGSIKPEDVSYIKFYSDETVFNIGYSGTSSDWVLGESQTSYIVSDINWSNMLFKFGLSKNDGVNYTIKWDVFTGDAKAPVAAEAEGTSFAITTNSTDFGGTSKIPVSAFKKCDGGAKIVVEFTQETAPWWNLGLHSDAAGGWANLSEYITSHKCNSHGYIDTFSAGDNTITVELSAEGVEKIIKDNGGLLFQVKSMKVTKATVIPVGGAPKATPTPTPKPTATPTPEPTPVPKFTTIGEQLVVTADMVSEKGELVIKDSKFDEIIVPDGLKLTNIVFDNVEAENAVIPGGVDYSVALNNAKIDVLDVAAPAVEEMTYDVLVALLEAAKELQADAAAYRAQITKIVTDYNTYLTAKATAATAQVKVTAGKWTEVGTLNIKGGASLNVTEGNVEKVVVDTADTEERLRVKLDGFNGDLAVKQEKAEGEKKASVSLNLGNSVIKNFDLVGGDGACAINSSKATVEKMTVSSASNVSLLVDVEELVVDEETENADIRVYSDVTALAVQGNKNDIILPASATVESATVVGNDVRIYGVGTLANAEVTGTGANVAIFGTEVEGENSTEVPGEMQEMLPTPIPTATPIPPVEKLEVEVDSSYPGNYSAGNVIPSSAFARFNDSVIIKLEYTVDQAAVDAAGSSGVQFAFVDSAAEGWPQLATSAGAGWKWINLTDANGIMYITLNPEQLAAFKAAGSVKAQYYCMYITKMTIIAFDSASNVETTVAVDSAYPGNYKEGNTIPSSAFKKYYDYVIMNVDYTVDQATVDTDGSSGVQFAFINSAAEGWPKLPTATGAEWNWINMSDANGKLTMILTPENLKTFQNASVKAQYYGMYINSITLVGRGEGAGGTTTPEVTPDPTPGAGDTEPTPDPTPGAGDTEPTPDPTPGAGDTEPTPDPTPGEGEVDPTPGEGDTTPVPTPLVTEIQLNTGYAGDYNPGNTIPYTVFAQYTDSVEVTLKYVLYNGATTGKFCTANGWDDYVGSNWIDVDNTKSEVTFTLSKENVAEITEDKIAIGFKALNMVITEASITGAGTAVENALYGGDDATEHSFSAKELEALGAGNVQITFEYTSLGYWKDRVQFTDTSGNWSNLKASHFVDLAYEQDEWDYVILSGDKVTVTVSEEKINSIITNGASLNLRVNGVILDNITIAAVKAEEATPTPVYGVILEEEKSLATWNDSFSVAADKFANYKFDGSEKMLITYKCLETANYSQLKYISGDWGNTFVDSYLTEYTTVEATEVVALTASFSALATTGLVVQGYNITISEIETIAEETVIWTGNQEVHWDNGTSLSISDSALFADLKFDGTERLCVYYTMFDTSKGWGQYQFVEGGWGENLLTENVGCNSIERIEDAVLTSTFKTIAEKGLIINGYNLVVTKVSIIK